MSTDKIIKAAESTHWYTPKGKPCYQVLKKKKRKADPDTYRDTTLRDARKLGLFPSVTTVMNVQAKPGLEVWKQNQILLAAATLPAIKDEPVDDWVKRVKEDAQKQAIEAAEEGTRIHAEIERFYKGELIAEKYNPHVSGTSEIVSNYLCDYNAHSPTDYITAEKSFAHELGFAGKSDLSISNRYISRKWPHGIVFDIKTKDFGDEVFDVFLPNGKEKKGKTLHWPENVIQLAAYAYGLGMQKAALVNIYVSRNNPGLAIDHLWSPEDAAWGWAAFKALFNCWKVLKKYDPINPN